MAWGATPQHFETIGRSQGLYSSILELYSRVQSRLHRYSDEKDDFYDEVNQNLCCIAAGLDGNTDFPLMFLVGFCEETCPTWHYRFCRVGCNNS